MAIMRKVSAVKRATAANGRYVGTVGLALALLAGCSSQMPPRADETKVRQFAGGGYIGESQYNIGTTFATWGPVDERLDVALTVPTQAGHFPLVVYLPALGETRSAGEKWRSAWAQAGYAVLSLQPLEDDARAWTSSKARSGDFLALARERYAAPAMAARLKALRQALAELRQRQAHGEPTLDRIDLNRVAIAGYDLGAYVAMVVAGEQLNGLDTTQWALPVPVQAAIALSPFADLSGLPFAARYAAIRVPVLAVTSDGDTDAVGLVSSAAVRRAPFDHMPGDGKYLLLVGAMPHSALAGAASLGVDSGGSAAPGDKAFSPERAGGAGRSANIANIAQFAYGQGSRGAAGRSPEGAQAGRNRPSGIEAGATLTELAIGTAAIQGITTAFLDAYVKGDPIAHAWLDRDASRWLAGRGTLQRK